MTIDLIADYETYLHDVNRAEATIDCYIGLLRRMDRELPYGLHGADLAQPGPW